MAKWANPYMGEQYGFPKQIPANLPDAGFEAWLLQEGYPVSLMVPPPGFPEGTPFFVSIFDDMYENGFTNPNSINYKDPYDPANTAHTFSPDPIVVPEPDDPMI